jgi:hypothetical protein
MNIILVGGPHDGERWNVSDDSRHHHRVRSSYKITDEMTDEGRRVFKYDKEASERRQPDQWG